ncbi:MAG: hypothetical protein Q9160_004672 [Pyrenula sp. 1 TL-2023]
MTFLVPSYFQKRLLRYALSRLDLIDTDALDLEKLDINLGQTSTVELRDLGLKRQRLIETLKLPESFDILRTQLRSLRVTVPANLYTTGILVEVSGIDIQIRVREKKKDNTRDPRRHIPRSASSRKSQAATPPHFASPFAEPSSPLDEFQTSYPVPSSKDLATSFLDAEPREERLGLEAALSLQSDLAQASTYKSQHLEDEMGIGPDGGISLPTFLTGFFQGIADRLRVSIHDVSISAVFSNNEESEGKDQAVPEEPVPFMEAVLKVAEIAVEDVRPDLEFPSTPGGKRHISFSNLSVELISDFEDRSSTSARKAGDHSSSTQHRRARTHSDPPDNIRPFRLAGSVLSTSSASTVSSLGTTRLRSSNHLGVHSDGEDSNSVSGTDALSNPMLLASQNSSTELSTSSIPEDLAESKIFTHEEAASMYLSAVSETRDQGSDSPNMPGGWNEPATPAYHERSLTGSRLRPEQKESSLSNVPQASQDSLQSLRDRHSQSSSTSVLGATEKSQTQLSLRSASQASKKILWIDTADVSIPSSPTSEQPDDSTPGSYSATGSHLYGSSDGLGSSETRSPLNETSVKIATLSGQIDLVSCQVLVRAAELLNRPAQFSSGPHQSNSDPSSSETPLALKIRRTNLAFYESVPTCFNSRPMASSLPSSDDSLIRLEIEKFDGQSHPVQENTTREMRFGRIYLIYGTHRLLSFDQTASLRESIKDVLSSGDDVRISTKYTGTKMNLEVNTLPVQIFLDLPTIDDFLSRSGGLSSLLDVGSSLSTISAGGPSRLNNTKASRVRSVRFQTEVQGESFHAAEPPTGKTNIRFQGLTLTINGSEAALRLQTSAVKVVHRSEGLGLQVDKANLSGPYFNDWRQRPAVKVNLENTRIEYLQSPREADLDRLLAILSPSKGKFEEDDDIMLDTLLRQRRKGPVLRATFDTLKTSIDRLNDLRYLPTLGNEISRLSTVAKYLPEDDRPGLLFLLLLKNADIVSNCSDRMGKLSFSSKALEIAHVSLPALAALKIPQVYIHWRGNDLLLGESVPLEALRDSRHLPMVMCKFIADEMDPAIKIKLFNITCEYSVSMVMAFLGLDGNVTGEDLAANLANSITTLEKDHSFLKKSSGVPSPLSSSDHNDQWAERLKVFVAIKDCTLGLNPRGISSKCLVLLSDAGVESTLHRAHNPQASLVVSKASVMLIDHVENILKDTGLDDLSDSSTDKSHQDYFAKSGFVPVGFVSSAAISVKCSRAKGDERIVDVDIKDDLLILETAADSTQTLVGLFSGLQPPMPVSKVARYRTEVVPIEDMLASLSGDAFVSEQGPEAGLRASVASMSEDQEQANEDDIEYVSEFYPPVDVEEDDDLDYSTDNIIGDADNFEGNSVKSFEALSPTYNSSDASDGPLDFQATHFESNSKIGSTTHGWGAQHTKIGSSNDLRVRDCPLRIRVRDVHVIWNLFDGYDWQSTRDQITKTVQDVEQRAHSRRDRANIGQSAVSKDEEDTFIGDCLFNSVYIGIQANRDPKELTRDINRNIDDLISETSSHATTSTITQSLPKQASKSNPRAKKLRLARSKHHKMTFEIRGINADFLVFPDSGTETQSSLDLRINDLVVFDHIPTSTWRKFATYMLDAGERQSDTSMVHVRLLNVKPVVDLAATEIVLKVSILPLRLHVDQDALDFMSRFFEFKDDSVPSSTETLPPFFQRVEVNPVKIQLDFKPKRVDYGGLRSGRTTEFMNFFVLDAADMVLRRVILYGVSGFDRLGQTLNDIWMPDVKRNQLPGILAGLAPVRSLVNVGGGVKDLVVIPMREYRKDGRIVRSVQKGAVSFAKTTTKELVRLGAKLALGTQTVLQNAETALGPGSPDPWTEEDLVEDAGKKISLYADQPLGVVQGLRGAYASLERDLVLTKDAIVAVPGEVIESGSAGGAARAVLKQAPTVVLRPAIGMSKAIGQTLLGAGNTLDKQNIRRAEEKYKLQ